MEDEIDFAWMARLIVLTQRHIDVWAKCDSESPGVSDESLNELWTSAGDLAEHLRIGGGMTEH